MKVRVVAFARVREVLGFGERDVELPAGATARDAWNVIAEGRVALRELERSTRIARNGAIVGADVALGDGDEVALLPPVGGG